MPDARLGAGTAVRRAAITALVRIEQGAWSDRLVRAAAARLADPRDRALLTRLVYTTLRWQLAIDPLLDAAALPATERCALRLAVTQAAVLELPVPIAVSSVVGALAGAGDRRRAGRVNARLRRLFREGVPVLDPVRTVPDWLVERWGRTFGPEAARAIAAASTRPARPFVVDLERWAGRSPAGAGHGSDAARRSALVPGGAHAGRGAPATGPEARAVAVDEGAAVVARLAVSGPPGRCADLTAAPGGKTLLLAHGRNGPLVALERHAGRVRALARRLHEWGLGRTVALARADATRPPLAARSFASVMLDAPCSGTGTLRRRPERRLRITSGGIERVADLQRRLLEAASELVASGGVLVYAVCSLEPEEGFGQVMDFLARHDEFDLDDAPAALGPAGAEVADPRDPRCVLLRPDRGAWEGFQAARLVRRRREPAADADAG